MRKKDEREEQANVRAKDWRSCLISKFRSDKGHTERQDHAVLRAVNAN